MSYVCLGEALLENMPYCDCVCREERCMEPGLGLSIPIVPLPRLGGAGEPSIGYGSLAGSSEAGEETAELFKAAHNTSMAADLLDCSSAFNDVTI